MTKEANIRTESSCCREHSTCLFFRPCNGDRSTDTELSRLYVLRSGDVLQVENGSLYPALHRLERQSWVQSEWKQSESKQKARY